MVKMRSPADWEEAGGIIAIACCAIVSLRAVKTCLFRKKCLSTLSYTNRLQMRSGVHFSITSLSLPERSIIAHVP